MIDTVDNYMQPPKQPSLKVTSEDFPELGAPKSLDSWNGGKTASEPKNGKQPKVKLKSEGNGIQKLQETSSTSLGEKTKSFNLQGLANALKSSSLDKPKKKNRKGNKSNKNENIENERQVQENSRVNGSASKQVFENSSTDFTNNSSYTASKSDIFMLGLLDNKPRRGHFEYVPPDNFQQRNLDLIKRIQTLTNHNSSSFGEFKSMSGHFRRNSITADVYFSKCVAMFGKRSFNEVFSELLVLLPDIDKQTELLVVYVAETDKSSVDKYFRVCNTCQQVLAPQDFSLHKFTHRG